MLCLVIEILKSLLAGEFKSWLAEYKEKEANEAKNKATALSNAAAIDELRKWSRRE